MGVDDITAYVRELEDSVRQCMHDDGYTPEQYDVAVDFQTLQREEAEIEQSWNMQCQTIPVYAVIHSNGVRCWGNRL